jgi:hypothetical protein
MVPIVMVGGRIEHGYRSDRRLPGNFRFAAYPFKTKGRGQKKARHGGNFSCPFTGGLFRPQDPVAFCGRFAVCAFL